AHWSTTRQGTSVARSSVTRVVIDVSAKGGWSMRRPKLFVRQSVRTLLMLVALILVVQIGFVNSAGQAKVDICHFDKEAGIWKKISIGEPAVAPHLANHDDAAPGGTTSKTGRALDADCQLPLCGNCLTANGGLGCEVSACESAVCA